MNHFFSIAFLNLKPVRIALLLIGLLWLSGSVSAQISRPGLGSKPYNEHTPSYDTMLSAKRAYEAGQFYSALSSYKSAARWADKFAQFNVGVMYLRGEGTEFDPVQAWAWFELAAERDYPDMVEAADSLWPMLDEAQQAQAIDIFENELMPQYGDDIAIEKTARKMARERRKATGSRLGAAGALTIIDRDGLRREGSEFYAEEKWNFQSLLEYETALVFAIARGRVEVGEFNVIEDDEQAPQQEEQPD